MSEAPSCSVCCGDWKNRPLRKAQDQDHPMKPSSLRAIPSVDKVLLALGETDLPRPAVVAVARRELAALRKVEAVPELDDILARIRGAIQKLNAARIRPVINGTGVLIHTNLGRAPLGRAVVETLSRIGSQYSNLEYSLADGERGGRAAYLEHNLALLCGAEAATVVNNNAAALILILRHFCGAQVAAPGQRRAAARPEAPPQKNEVIISRGELIQIGGGFRIPEILEASGARLREVGTTNKTALGDYARAINPQTALILKVHRSNFFMDGFVESPLPHDIAALAHEKRIPFIEDLGSGAMIATQRISGLEPEPTPIEVLRQGADLVCFSGDKLFGGPQAGIIAGKAKFVGALKREPFFRALRCDKLILSALETLVDTYLRGGGVTFAPAKDTKQKSSTEIERLDSTIPVLEMLSASNDELRLRAKKIISALDNLAVKACAGTGRAQVGGGTLPRSVIPSVTIELTHPTLKPQQIAARLRERSVPVIGYIEHGKFKLDLRAVFPHQDEELIRAIQALCGLRS
jgi:L-seryl-tRNA(Ser) seleniumtransferase